MIRSTPHPPEHPTTHPATVDMNLGNLSLFTVKPGAKIEDVLLTASDYLTCAAATAYEVAENSTKEFRPLARAVVHQLEVARALIDASVDGVGKEARGLGIS